MIAALVPGFLMIAGAAHSVVFNDGMVHVIDAGNSYPLEAMTVDDGPTMPTTVTIVEGGQIATLATSNEQSFLIGSSIADMSGGEIGTRIHVAENSRMTVSGGLINAVSVPSNATVSPIPNFEITGGQVVSGVVVAGGKGEISGNAQVGSIGGTGSMSTGHLSILGGSIGLHVFSRDGSTIDIRGGTFGMEPSTGLTFRAEDSSTISIYGRSFNFPIGDIPVSVGTLTGVLQDGSPLDYNFASASTAIITLISATPVAPAFPGWAMGALSVLLIVSAGWVMATRRRHRPA
jgi:hypothetical protein